MEQALSLSHATQRFMHLGWRVIRIEATPSGGRLPGDPNRYVGKEGERPDMHTYFIGPNAGKETISLNLKDEKGREVLHRLIRDLPVDVFACNTLPRRYIELGIDYATLSAVNPGIIWAGLSAMGPDYPDVPGYDPVIQALTGYMDLTGDSEGPPMLCGVPFVDLKAGDEVFAGVLLALVEKAETGKGKRIHVSMAQAAASWLVTTIPLMDLGYEPHEVKRSGNEHREFVPVNVYPTSDGYIYIAVGNDVQWARLTGIKRFGKLSRPERDFNEGRKKDREALHGEMGEITRSFKTKELLKLLNSKGLVAAPIRTIPEVLENPPVLYSLLETERPSGRKVRLPPPAVETDYLHDAHHRLPFAPAYGEHTDKVLADAGFKKKEIEQLRKAGITA